MVTKMSNVTNLKVVVMVNVMFVVEMKFLLFMNCYCLIFSLATVVKQLCIQVYTNLFSLIP